MTAFITPGICLALIHLINSNKNRAFYTVVSVLGFTTILLASSRGSFLTLLIITGIIITHFMLKKKFSVGKIVIFLVFLLSIAFFFFYIQGNEKYIRLTDYESYVDNVRLQIWSTGIELFNENKVIGNGFNSASNYTKSRIGFYTHNNFLDILIEQGVMGILLHILLFRNMLKVSLKNKIYILVLILAFFIPLFFINGYGTATFWTPMIFCQLISDYLKKEDILFYDLY
ncbi:MAG TPA: O-antigen ligase family protein [Gallicola sp.]|nr:O-antigen ligase family protein [Gallicola sp.]